MSLQQQPEVGPVCAKPLFTRLVFRVLQVGGGGPGGEGRNIWGVVT